MKKFTNENVKKVEKRMHRNIIIAIILIIISFGFKSLEQKEVTESREKMQDLHSIIVDKDDKTGRLAYIDNKTVPFEFAVYDDTTDSYYFVADDNYLYIVYMSKSDYYSLDDDSIYEKGKRIEGVTRETPKDVKKLAIDTYNTSIENEDEKLTLADFDNYFGEVYLDMTADSTSFASFLFMLFFLTLIFGSVLLLVAGIQLMKFKAGLKRLDSFKVDELDSEMNDKDAFYYEKAHLYLTRNYIINFGGSFRIINYDDILWIYPFIQRTNGVKTSQSIKVLTKDGKTSTVATIDVVTKKKKEVYDEIYNTIMSKNSTMLAGYTKENIKAMKEKVKEIKRGR